MVVDPACGMEVDPGDPPATAEYDDETYYFCSEGCRERFERDPGRFARRAVPELYTVSGMLTPRMPIVDAKGEFELSVADADDLGVGDRVTYTPTLDEEDVQKFAEASGDTNALHLNEEFAERTRFGRRIVHGTLVAGTISAALAAFPGMTIYLSQDLEFQRPVDIGATVTTTCEIVEKLDEDRYRLTTRVENAEGEVVIDGSATVLVDDLPTLPDADEVEGGVGIEPSARDDGAADGEESATE